jgi:hypothetical protein
VEVKVLNWLLRAPCPLLLLKGGEIMKSNSKIIIGSILALSGAVTLIGNLNIISENFILPMLGAAFLFIYFILGARKSYGNIGFLIPGIILSALQILKFADDNSMSEKAIIVVVFGVLSASFFLIYIVHTYWFKQVGKGQRNWPLYVSIIILFCGVFAYAIEYFNWSFGAVILNNMWPAVLVIVGARMLYKALKGSRRKLDV